MLPQAPSLRGSVRWALLLFVGGAGVGALVLVALAVVTPGIPNRLFQATRESLSGRFEQYRGLLAFDVLVIFVNNWLISLVLALSPVFIASIEHLLRSRPASNPIRRLDAFLDRLAVKVIRLFRRHARTQGMSMSWRYPLLAIPALILFLNGILLGFFATFTATRGLERLALFFILVAPHGILEFPGFLLAAGLGHWSAWRSHVESATASGQTYRPWHIFRTPLWKRVIWVATFLLALAATVETYVTPLVPWWLRLV